MRARMWLRGESGSVAVEYGLLLALVSIAAIAGLQALGLTLVDLLDGVTSALEKVSAALR